MLSNSKNSKGFANHPIVVCISIAASVITILGFLTGYENIYQFIKELFPVSPVKQAVISAPTLVIAPPAPPRIDTSAVPMKEYNQPRLAKSTPTEIHTRASTEDSIDEISVGKYVRVYSAENGLSVREGPGTNNACLSIAAESEIVLVIDGPNDDENDEDYQWWYVRQKDLTEGWVAANYIEPVSTRVAKNQGW